MVMTFQAMTTHKWATTEELTPSASFNLSLAEWTMRWPEFRKKLREVHLGRLKHKSCAENDTIKKSLAEWLRHVDMYMYVQAILTGLQRYYYEDQETPLHTPMQTTLIDYVRGQEANKLQPSGPWQYELQAFERITNPNVPASQTHHNHVFLAPITAATHREYDCCKAILEEAPPEAVYKYVAEIGRTLHKKSVGIAALLTCIYNHDFQDSNLQSERQSVAHSIHEPMPSRLYQKVELWIEEFELTGERYLYVFGQNCDRDEMARGARFLTSLQKAPWFTSFRDHFNQLAMAKHLGFWTSLSYHVIKQCLIDWMTHNRGY